MGGVFRVISPAVIHGMLAGIGGLIVLGQFHILFDAKPLSSGLENLVMVPSRILGLTPFNLRSTELALAIGLLTIGTMLAWEKFRPARLSLLPGALLGVVAATLIAWTLGLGVARVDVPSSILASFALPEGGFFGPLAARPALLVSALVIAFIASAETLLSAAAVDRMHDGVRTDYNKELRAQGVGNLICGMLGALPMTGVIVRSSANVQAGAKDARFLGDAWRMDPLLRRAAAMAVARSADGGAGWRAGAHRLAADQPQACKAPVARTRRPSRGDLVGHLRAGGRDRPPDRCARWGSASRRWSLFRTPWATCASA